jgi:hypothetical protein
MRASLLALVIASAAATAVAAAVAAAVAFAETGSSSSDRDERARAAFADVHRVLTSPRCRNCHPTSDTPLQRDDGVPHAQNVSRLSEKNGLRCTTCHRHDNAPVEGGPPGVEGWRMPPADTPMVFAGRTPAELCAQLKDTEATRGRDLAALLSHVRDDHLVHWAWNPGPGRTKPPLTHEQFVDRFAAWIDHGAACPE